MINIYGPVNNLGYGIHCQNMLKVFIENDIPINLTPLGQVQDNPWFTKYWQEASSKYEQFDKTAPSLHIFHDEYSHQCTGNPVVAFSVFETTHMHPRALHNLKNVVDMIFVTTQEHAWILQDEGLEPSKIHVVHEGVDPTLYNTEPCKPLINTGKFTYITVGKKEERKNTNMIISTFIQTMQYQECALIAHTFSPFEPIENAFTDVSLQSYGFKLQQSTTNAYRKFSNGICDIYLTAPVLEQAKMKNLYHSANVGIALSRAEGWDLPLIELLACGVPTIASNVIGHSEYLSGAPKAVQDLIVEPKGKEVANDGKWFRGDRGEWSIIEKEDLSDFLEETYDNQDDYTSLNTDISKYYHDNFNWNLPALRVKELLT